MGKVFSFLILSHSTQEIEWIRHWEVHKFLLIFNILINHKDQDINS